MTTAATTLSVQLLGREYRVACADDERADLLAAVRLLDQRMREVRDSGKGAALEKVAVMTALNLANELLKLRSKGPESAFDSTEIQRRIVSMQVAIDEVMASQEQLF
jgi:cell division protein ZapA